MNCLNCGKELTGRQRKWCSDSCYVENRNKTNYKDKEYLQKIYSQRKDRSNQRKLKIIESLGGCCSKCGYKRNAAALEFHHIDPSKKEIQISARELGNYSEERILKELEKCVLLCANCHREEHNPHLNID